jgi:hypothetical protein
VSIALGESKSFRYGHSLKHWRLEAAQMAEQQIVFWGGEVFAGQNELSEKKVSLDFQTWVAPYDKYQSLRTVGSSDDKTVISFEGGPSVMMPTSLKIVLERWAATKDELFINLTDSPVPKIPAAKPTEHIALGTDVA